jgi:hypothetical protein
VDDAVEEFCAAAAESQRQGAWSFVIRALVDLAQTSPTDLAPREALRKALPHVSDPTPGSDLLQANTLISEG